MKKYEFLYLLFALFVLPLGSFAESNAKDSGDAIATFSTEFEECLKSAKSNSPHLGSYIKPELNTWDSIQNRISTALNVLADQIGEDKAAEVLVGYFGKRDYEGDLIVALSDSRAFVPLCFKLEPYFDQDRVAKFREQDQIQYKKRNRLAMAIVKQHTKLLLSNHEMVIRYTNLVLIANRFVQTGGDAAIAEVRQRVAEICYQDSEKDCSKDDVFYWRCRQFIVLACLLNQDHYYEAVNQENFPIRMTQYLSWIDSVISSNKFDKHTENLFVKLPWSKFVYDEKLGKYHMPFVDKKNLLQKMKISFAWPEYSTLVTARVERDGY